MVTARPMWTFLLDIESVHPFSLAPCSVWVVLFMSLNIIFCNSWMHVGQMKSLLDRWCCCVICAIACGCEPCGDYRSQTPKLESFSNSVIAYSAAELDNMNKRERKEYLLSRVASAGRKPHQSGRTTWQFPVSNGSSTVMVCRAAFQRCFFITRYYAQSLMKMVRIAY